MLVATFLLNGGLYQVISLWRFFLSDFGMDFGMFLMICGGWLDFLSMSPWVAMTVLNHVSSLALFSSTKSKRKMATTSAYTEMTASELQMQRLAK